MDKSGASKSCFPKIEGCLKSLIEGIPSHAAILDREGTIMAINKAAPWVRAKNVLGRCFFDLLPKETGDLMKDAAARALSGGKRIDLETSISSDDGTVSWWANRFSQFKHNGKTVGVIVVCTDITGPVMADRSIRESEERFRRAEEALFKSKEELERRVQERTLELTRSEEKYHNIFDSAMDGIFVLDIKGNVIDVNATAYGRLGYTKDEMLSMNISGLTPPEFAMMVPERLSEIQDKGMAIFESAHKKKDGSLMLVEVNARMIEHEGGRAYFSIVRDITGRKQSEDALKESQKLIETILELTPT